DFDLSIAGCSALISSGRENDAVLASAYQHRGIAYFNKGLIDQSIADQSSVIALKPDQASAYYDRAEAYLAQGRFEDAITDYDRAVLIKPRYAEAYADRGAA